MNYAITVYDSLFGSFVHTNCDEFETIEQALKEVARRTREYPNWFGTLDIITGVNDDESVNLRTIARYGRMTAKFKAYEQLPKIS